jgi:hypothetical protein
MTKWLIAILATALTLAFAPAAWADCTDHPYDINGHSIRCTTCGYGFGRCYTSG